MDKNGQITLEIVIMVLIAINIFAYITLPLSHVGRTASQNMGVSALAAEAVDAIANQVNIVGAGGDGARGSAEIFLSKDFTELTCAFPSVGVKFKAYSATTVGNPKNFGVLEAIGDYGERPYSKPVDFPMTFDDSDLHFNDTKACVCLENVAGTVNVVAYDRPAGGCRCWICHCGDCQTCNEQLIKPKCKVVELSGDIITDSDCISMLDYKTLDCAGYKIQGDGADKGIGLPVISPIDPTQGVDGSTIRNCVISNWQVCILFDNWAMNNRLINTTVNNCGTGINFWPQSQNNLLTDNTACGNVVDISVLGGAVGANRGINNTCGPDSVGWHDDLTADGCKNSC